MGNKYMTKYSWKHGAWNVDGIKITQKTFIKKTINGLLSGGSVWAVIKTNQRKKFDSLCIGTIDGGQEMARSLLGLLNISTKETRDARITTNTHDVSKHKSISKYLTIRLGAEEALYLVHAMKCLRVYKNVNKSDVWIQLSSGSYETLHLMS